MRFRMIRKLINPNLSLVILKKISKKKNFKKEFPKILMNLKINQLIKKIEVNHKCQ